MPLLFSVCQVFFCLFFLFFLSGFFSGCHVVHLTSKVSFENIVLIDKAFFPVFRHEPIVCNSLNAGEPTK